LSIFARFAAFEAPSKDEGGDVLGELGGLAFGGGDREARSAVSSSM